MNDRQATPSTRVRFAWYAAALLLALAFPAAGYRLDAVSLRAPLSHEREATILNDSYLILPMVQATLEGGTHWRSERLGFPGVQHMHDFPVIDHLHFACLWLIGQFTGDTIVAFNLYYLLGYPLAALTMMLLVRSQGGGLAAAAAAGLLFAALPYHQHRGQNHYFLSAYFMVPAAAWVILEICLGRLPFFEAEATSRYRLKLKSRHTLTACVFMALVSCAGAYYAFFACALLCAAGLYAAVVHRTWRAVASAGLMIAITTLCGAANHLPTFIYHARYGRHTEPVLRAPEDAEFYGLKIAQLLLPVDDHHLRMLAEFKSIYNSYLRPVQAYTERYSLGMIPSAGFVVLMALLMLQFTRRQPYHALAFLTGAAVLIGTVGGFGAIFNQTITPAVRCYNRIAIYIACFCLLAVVLAVEACCNRAARGRLGSRPWFAPAVWCAVVAFGLWDCTPYDWATAARAERIRENQALFFQDRQFFQAIEQQLNPAAARPGPAVFQLPYVMWPESPATFQLGPYDHARGYLHTRTLRWSYGCMRGREIDEWYRSVAVLAPAAIAPMLDRILRGGFEGLLLDKRGYSPRHAKLIEDQLLHILPGAAPIRHPDGHRVFFDLRRHRDDIRSGRDWEAECWRETHRPSILWLDGFTSYREPGYEWQQRHCGRRGLAIFVNPTQETQTFTCVFRLTTDFTDPARLVIDGGELWSETLAIDRGTPPIARTFTIPPGRHAVRFHCTPPKSHMPNEHRRLVFQVQGLKLD